MIDCYPQRDAELSVLGGLLSSDNVAKQPQLPDLPEINQLGPRRDREQTLLHPSEWVSDPASKKKRSKK
jgi:hypothetical protein